MPQLTSRRAGRLQVIAGVLALLLLGIWLGGHPGWMPGGIRRAFVAESQGRLVEEIISDLRRDYYRPVSGGTLLSKGLQGAVASLNDPYSHYFDPASYRQFQKDDDPHVSGIGIDVSQDARGLVVVDVFPGSPAARAGLKHGDVIVAAAGQPLGGQSDTFASGLIRGRPGSTVTLTIEPAGGGGRRKTVTVTRAAVVVPVASGAIARHAGRKVGVVTLTSFTDGSGAETADAVRKVIAQGADALVLDLRENGGGLLNEAVSVASLFIADGTIVSTAGRSQPRQVYTAKGHPVAPRLPMVVLVDQGTASASEIVTGALRDRGRATVVGTRTYGKGVFQELLELSNGGALDITVGEYFTPSGQNLGGGGVRQGTGIKPQVYALDNPHTRIDEALEVALQTVTGR